MLKHAARPRPPHLDVPESAAGRGKLLLCMLCLLWSGLLLAVSWRNLTAPSSAFLHFHTCRKLRPRPQQRPQQHQHQPHRGRAPGTSQVCRAAPVVGPPGRWAAAGAAAHAAAALVRRVPGAHLGAAQGPQRQRAAGGRCPVAAAACGQGWGGALAAQGRAARSGGAPAPLAWPGGWQRRRGSRRAACAAHALCLWPPGQLPQARGGREAAGAGYRSCSPRLSGASACHRHSTAAP